MTRIAPVRIVSKTKQTNMSVNTSTTRSGIVELQYTTQSKNETIESEDDWLYVPSAAVRATATSQRCQEGQKRYVDSLIDLHHAGLSTNGALVLVRAWTSQLRSTCQHQTDGKTKHNGLVGTLCGVGEIAYRQGPRVNTVCMFQFLVRRGPRRVIRSTKVETEGVFVARALWQDPRPAQVQTRHTAPLP